MFDTNVLIPLLLPASHSTRLLDRLDRAGWRVALSPQILAEVADRLRHKSALRRWLELPDDDIDEFVGQDLPAKTLAIAGRRQAHGAVPADPKDDKIVAAALEAKAIHIVTEDKHLLDLESYNGIRIVNRLDFDAELDRLGLA
ncbi:MAG: putative toxin-antitoxin system toxin component, PIN family [Planctomycetota bacterium]